MTLIPDKNSEFRKFKEKFNIVLNSQQDSAVRAIDGANLLLAVPGSGKTTVLVARLGYMILCKNIAPQNILALTYTKAATEDIRARFRSFFGENLANKIEFRTINSIADKIIKKYTDRPFEIIDDTKEIVKKILQRTQTSFPTENEINEAITKIAYYKNMMIRPEKIEDEDDAEIFGIYNEFLKQSSLMDYDDQLVYAHTILRKYPRILEYFQDRYQYICVDEAQDTSKLQHEIIRLLAMKYKNIFMVGDEDQSIYGFRAAYPRALTEFRSNYPNASVYYMETNYRSTKEIVKTSADFIEKNIDRYSKKIVSSRGYGAPVLRIPVKNREDQYKFLLELAKRSNKNTAILYRDNDSAIPLIDLMLRNNIPFNVNKLKGLFFTNRLVSDIKNFMQLAVDQYDTESFMQIYYKCNFGFNKKMAELVCAKSMGRKMTVADALIRQNFQQPHMQKNAKEFGKFLSDIASNNPLNALNIIYDRYESFMTRQNMDYDKFELLQVLASAEKTVGSFLERLYELQLICSDEKPEKNNGITLSTVHSAKGLEFDSVYITDVFDGTFPSVTLSAAQKDKDEMDCYMEERRLFYVAMTRAKNELAVISISDRKSSFIDEIISSKEADSLARGYAEVRGKFGNQKEIIYDSEGRRWVRCEICGEIKPSTEFTTYGGKNVNCGKCSECYRKN
ncbi:MAG: ATP-dependent helicase [Clostridia bacterium]|nr:ATP-dependent helicase [Clostridia bacterium]